MVSTSQPNRTGFLRKTWRVTRWVLIFVVLPTLVTGLVSGLIYRWSHQRQAEQDYQEALAATNQVDPEWRWESVSKSGPPVPEAENSLPILLKADRMVNEAYRKQRADAPPEERERLALLDDTLKVLAPQRRLSPEDMQLLESQLKTTEEAWKLLQALTDRPNGSYEVELRDNLMMTLVPHIQAPRSAWSVCWYRGLKAIQVDDAATAMRVFRLGVNAARALRNERKMVTLAVLVQDALHEQLARYVERCLGQGQWKEADLVQMAVPFEQFPPADLFKSCLRAERAMSHEVLERQRHGIKQLDFDFHPIMAWAYVNTMLRYSQADLLTQMNRLIEVADQPFWQQQEVWKVIQSDVMQKRMTPDYRYIFSVLFLPAIQKIGEAHYRVQALNRCTVGALAAERFRMTEGRWPANWQELMPKYLKEEPRDPCRDAPLVLKRTPDGLIVYSVGSDGVDNEGHCNPAKPTAPGSDLVFRLFDPSHRRLPPLEKKPDEEDLTWFEK